MPTLIKRYKESRRPHPLGGRGRTIEDAIRREAELLTPVRARADYVVNTSNLTLGRLQQRIFSLFGGEARQSGITVNITAFGYKYGVPMDSIPRFLECSAHPEKITYKHPLLRPILEVTYGCIVYQEQVIEIFRRLAGFSLGQADLIRRAMENYRFTEFTDKIPVAV